MAARRHLLALFDIDGTLLHSGGAGKRAMIAAFRDVFGRENGFANVAMAGRTDPEIVREALAKQGIPWNPALVEAFRRRYLELIGPELAQPAPNKQLLPGIPAVLDALRTLGFVTLGLLTGNWREGAYAKLGYFGIDGYFRVGAFADDAEERDRLLPFALARAREATGLPLKPQDVVVVGDTTRDIDCARPHGAVTLAVATGGNSIEELASAAPDYLLPDLSDTEAVGRIFWELAERPRG
jgi:phosphoglycolate phosphatase-like HAD superfamily hydrolase